MEAGRRDNGELCTGSSSFCSHFIGQSEPKGLSYLCSGWNSAVLACAWENQRDLVDSTYYSSGFNIHPELVIFTQPHCRDVSMLIHIDLIHRYEMPKVDVM